MEHAAPLSYRFTYAGIRRAAVAPFVAIGRFIILLAEAGPQMDAVRRLNAMSDEDLKAKGLTREGEVRRIFGHRFYP